MVAGRGGLWSAGRGHDRRVVVVTGLVVAVAGRVVAVAGRVVVTAGARVVEDE